MAALTPLDLEALEMFAGFRPIRRGAWLNACYVWLVANGLLTFECQVTIAGASVLAAESAKDITP